MIEACCALSQKRARAAWESQHGEPHTTGPVTPAHAPFIFPLLCLLCSSPDAAATFASSAGGMRTGHGGQGQSGAGAARM